jgi:hypothetical protein
MISPISTAAHVHFQPPRSRLLLMNFSPLAGWSRSSWALKGSAFVFFCILVSSATTAATLTLTPAIPLIGGAPARPGFTLSLNDARSYDANGVPADDWVTDYSIATPNGHFWQGYTPSFFDPRGNLGAGIHSYLVKAFGLHAVPYNNGWWGTIWEEEHDNIWDPDEVTGGHWVDGSYDAGFTWDSASFGSATLVFDLQAGTAQKISFANPGTRNINTVFSLGGTASSGLPVSYSITGGGTLSGATFTATKTGLITIRTFRATGVNAGIYYLAAPHVDQTFFVTDVFQNISFPLIDPQTFLNPPFPVSATASSGLPVTLTVTAGPATLSGNVVSLSGAGNVTVTATQAGNGTYAAVSASQTFTVAKAAQTITFPPISARTQGNPYYLDATSSAGLPISYSVLAGPATVSLTHITGSAPGEVTVQAAQPGNANFHPAVGVARTFSVLSAIAVTQVATGLGTPPTFAITTTTGGYFTFAQLTVYDETDGVVVGLDYSTDYTDRTATWTDPRGLSFNGPHSYRFSITAQRGRQYFNYGPVTAIGTISGGPPGSISLIPGTTAAAGGAARFAVTIKNGGFGSGVTRLTVADITDGASLYPFSAIETGAITDTYTLHWTDSRAPTPIGPRLFVFTASGTVGAIPYSFTTRATYHETALFLQAVAPPNLTVPVQPKFDVAISAIPGGLTYVKVETASHTWYLTNGSGPTSTPTSIYPATTFSQRFADPRGILGFGSSTYTVTAFGRGLVSSLVWIDGHWEDEREDPDGDPNLVTGTHWEDGAYGYAWLTSDWVIVAQETITTPVTAPLDTTPPSTPALLVAGSLAPTSFGLSWARSTDNVGVTAYEVRQNGFSLGTTTALTSTIFGLLSGATYVMEVRARDAAGNWSAWATLDVQTIASSANVAFRASAVGTYSATLTWNVIADPSIFAGYKVYRKLGAQPAEEVGSTRGPVLTSSGLLGGTTYTYSLRRFNHQGVVESSDLASVIVTTTTSTTGHSDADGIPDNVEIALGTNTTTMATSEDYGLLQPTVHRPNQ